MDVSKSSNKISQSERCSKNTVHNSSNILKEQTLKYLRGREMSQGDIKKLLGAVAYNYPWSGAVRGWVETTLVRDTALTALIKGCRVLPSVVASTAIY